MTPRRRDRSTPILVDEIPYTVRTWWDYQSHNWITYILDDEGNQIGEAIYVYTGPDKVHSDIVADASARIRLELEGPERDLERYGEGWK